jgi:hypothetical protein
MLVPVYNFIWYWRCADVVHLNGRVFKMYISRIEDGLLRNLQFFRTFHQASLHQSPINATSYMHWCMHAIAYIYFIREKKCKQGIKLSPILSHSHEHLQRRDHCATNNHSTAPLLFLPWPWATQWSLSKDLESFIIKNWKFWKKDTISTIVST